MIARGADRGGARHVDQECDLAHEVVFFDGGDELLPAGRADEDIRLAGEDDVGDIAEVTFFHQVLPAIEANPLRHEGEEAKFLVIDPAEQRDLAERGGVRVDAHDASFSWASSLSP